MIKQLITRIQQGERTVSFPGEVRLSDRFRGLLKIDSSKCINGCVECVKACPTESIAITSNGPRIDLGRCVFCQECILACPTHAIQYSNDYRMATRTREGLVLDDNGIKLAEALDKKSRALFGHSLKLRQVSAGGCNGCEVEINALNNVVFDIARLGIQMVASPRHADGLLITGPVTENMLLALVKTYKAIPNPKIVVAVGGCAISGGPFRDLSNVRNGAASIVPVDLFIPGCPPHPFTILDGLLRLLGRLEAGD